MLMFTSLLAQGRGSPPVEAPFAWTTNLLYRFSAGEGVYSDDAGTVPADGDGVAVWANLGSAEDAVQTTAARRPTFRTGGLNGRSYIACDRSLEQAFEDLAFTQPGGILGLNPFTVFVVTDNVGSLANTPAIMGFDVSGGGKVRFYFQDSTDEQVVFVKSQIRTGTVANPQVIMAAAGRNAGGTTSSPFARFWVRQNGTGVFTDSTQGSNLSSAEVTATQFLRCSGLAGGGYFHGHLYEVLLYDGTLDDETTVAIEDWLMTRYGIV